MPKDFANAQDLVAVEDIREGTIIMRDGSLRQVVMVGGINFSLKSEDEQSIITGAYQNFLNSLNFQIQIIIHSRKINIERYLGTLEERRSGEPSGLLQSQIAEYIEFIRGFVAQNAIMAKTFFVVVPFAPVSLPKASSVGGMFSFFRKKDERKAKAASDEAAEKDFKENLAQIRQRTTQVLERLYAVGLEAKALEDEALVELFYNFYNPETIEHQGMPAPERASSSPAS